jgi:Flp pilus assembly protein TadG
MTTRLRVLADGLWRKARGRPTTVVRGEGSEQGQALVFFLVALPLILMLIALVVDGGMMYLEYVRARNAAELAAQAGAQAVDVSRFKATNEVQLNIDGSLYSMRQYMTLNSRNRHGEVRTTYYGHTAYAQVCTTTEVPTSFFRLFGSDTMRVGSCARAYPAYGIRWEGE